MREELNEKIDDLIDLLNNDSRLIDLENLKKRINNNYDIMEKIEKLRNTNPYSTEYTDLKKELFNDKDFLRFKQLENEVNYLILEINQRLNNLTDEKRCNNANN